VCVLVVGARGVVGEGDGVWRFTFNVDAAFKGGEGLVNGTMSKSHFEGALGIGCFAT